MSSKNSELNKEMSELQNKAKQNKTKLRGDNKKNELRIRESKAKLS